MVLKVLEKCTTESDVSAESLEVLVDSVEHRQDGIIGTSVFGEANCRGSWRAAVWPSHSSFSTILSVHLNGTEVSDTGLQSFNQLGDLFLGTGMTVDVFQIDARCTPLQE